MQSIRQDLRPAAIFFVASMVTMGCSSNPPKPENSYKPRLDHGYTFTEAEKAEIAQSAQSAKADTIKCDTRPKYQEACDTMMRGWAWVIENPKGALPPPEYFMEAQHDHPPSLKLNANLD